MSERYPVGTKVQVANGGLGSRFRNEDERVGEFAGMVIATSGSSYTGIPEVCVESETGERRVIMVGDLEETPSTEPVKGAPTMDKVKIWYESGAYEEVTAEHERFAELVAIFAECQVNGRIAAAELYEGNGNAQGFRRVDQADLTAPAPCGRQIDPRSIINEVPDMRPIVCARGHGHRGLHRDTVAIHHDTYKWGDDSCLPVDTTQTVD